VEYPIPRHIKDFFQLVGTDNSEYEVKISIKCFCGSDTFRVLVMISSQGKQDFIDECISNDDSVSEADWVDGFEWIDISLRCAECNYNEKWMECETM